jgi:hypothetical protein
VNGRGRSPPPVHCERKRCVSPTASGRGGRPRLRRTADGSRTDDRCKRVIRGVTSGLRGATRPTSEPPGVPKGWAAASDHSAVRSIRFTGARTNALSSSPELGKPRDAGHGHVAADDCKRAVARFPREVDRGPEELNVAPGSPQQRVTGLAVPVAENCQRTTRDRRGHRLESVGFACEGLRRNRPAAGGGCSERERRRC